MSHEFPETQASLLVSIRDPANEQAWSTFCELYRPVVYRMARRRGLQDADAQDLAQRVLVSVAGAIGEWESDPQHGRFRHWLARVTRNAIVDAFRRVRPDAARGGSSVLRALSQSAAANETEIEHEFERAVFRRAASVIRSEFASATWAAFWETTVLDRSPGDVAASLGQSVGSVYTARSRVMRRLREAVELLRAGEKS